MTLIIATPDSLYGDRRITADTGESCEPIKKIIGNEGCVAGFAGGIELILSAMKEVELGVDSPKILAKSGVEGLVVKQGRIYLLDLGKSWVRPKRISFYAVGTGASVAMAFLSGRGKIRHQDIRDCYRYVSRVRDDCGSKFDYLPG